MDDFSLKILVPFFSFKDFNNSNFYFFAIANRDEEDSTQIQIFASEHDDDDDDKNILDREDFMLSMIFILGVGCFIWAILTCTKFCCKSINATPPIVLTPTAQEFLAQRENDKKQYLELLDKTMPIKSFDELKISNEKYEDAISCSVCLSDFTKEDTCRMTICSHIFHSECLDKWMEKHQVSFIIQNCPFCRQNFNKDTLTEFLEQKAEQEIKLNLEEINLEVQESDKNESMEISNKNLPTISERQELEFNEKKANKGMFSSFFSFAIQKFISLKSQKDQSFHTDQQQFPQREIVCENGRERIGWHTVYSERLNSTSGLIENLNEERPLSS